MTKNRNRKNRTKRITIEVSFALPDGATQENARSYVEDAVATWKGQLRHPGGYDDDDEGDPLFQLNGDSVVARIQRKPAISTQ